MLQHVKQSVMSFPAMSLGDCFCMCRKGATGWYTKERKKKNNFGCLATLWFSTFLWCFFVPLRSLVGHERSQRWMLCCLSKHWSIYIYILQCLDKQHNIHLWLLSWPTRLLRGTKKHHKKVLNHKVAKQPKLFFFFLSLVYQPVAPFLHMQKQSPRDIAGNDITDCLTCCSI